MESLKGLLILGFLFGGLTFGLAVLLERQIKEKEDEE